MDIAMGGIPDRISIDLNVAEASMRKYLLGENSLSDSINNHVIFFTSDGETEDFMLSAAIPMIRRGMGGDTLWMDNKFSSVIVNLAGVLCITHICLNPQDIWENTQVSPENGEFKFPQKVSSWICADFFKRMIECYENMHKMTEKQTLLIKKYIHNGQNPCKVNR